MKFRPVVSSRYDHQDRRVQKVTPEATHTYFYDAFGKLISSSGLMADLFAFRYSTKYFDSETGFYYYGYRFYSPELKRWLTRDPIGEEGGLNLYVACCNNLLSIFDFRGLVPYRIGTTPPPKSVTLIEKWPYCIVSGLQKSMK